MTYVRYYYEVLCGIPNILDAIHNCSCYTVTYSGTCNENLVLTYTTTPFIRFSCDLVSHPLCSKAILHIIIQRGTLSIYDIWLHPDHCWDIAARRCHMSQSLFFSWRQRDGSSLAPFFCHLPAIMDDTCHYGWYWTMEALSRPALPTRREVARPAPSSAQWAGSTWWFMFQKIQCTNLLNKV